jgi:hypothetical protein
MRYPTKEQSDGARAQKAGDFGLTKRALAFARFYAETPGSISEAARAADYSDRARGAHVRGCELLRDPRVIRAILHFSALALARAQREAIENLRELAEDRGAGWRYWSHWDRDALTRLRLRAIARPAGDPGHSSFQRAGACQGAGRGNRASARASRGQRGRVAVLGLLGSPRVLTPMKQRSMSGCLSSKRSGTMPSR